MTRASLNPWGPPGLGWWSQASVSAWVTGFFKKYTGAPWYFATFEYPCKFTTSREGDGLDRSNRWKTFLRNDRCRRKFWWVPSALHKELGKKDAVKKVWFSLKGCHGAHMLASQEPGLLRQDGLPIQVPTPQRWIKVLKKMCMKSQFSVQSTYSLILLPVVFNEIQDYQSVYQVYWLKK